MKRSLKVIAATLLFATAPAAFADVRIFVDLLPIASAHVAPPPPHYYPAYPVYPAPMYGAPAYLPLYRPVNIAPHAHYSRMHNRYESRGHNERYVSDYRNGRNWHDPRRDGRDDKRGRGARPVGW